MIKIAIDGPSGAGKSTLSKKLAADIGFVYIDTGAMYRAAGLSCLKKGIDIKNEPQKAEDNVDDIKIDIMYAEDGLQRVFLDGEDVTDAIRTPEVSIAASDVSALKRVRIKLVELQRELAKNNNVLMDGRDIGTYVLPDAELKIFLTASAEERAKRRCEELILRGKEQPYREVLEDIMYRDKNDSEREFSPLRQADDAIVIDTTGNDFETSYKLLRELIGKKFGI